MRLLNICRACGMRRPRSRLAARGKYKRRVYFYECACGNKSSDRDSKDRAADEWNRENPKPLPPAQQIGH